MKQQLIILCFALGLINSPLFAVRNHPHGQKITPKKYMQLPTKKPNQSNKQIEQKLKKHNYSIEQQQESTNLNVEVLVAAQIIVQQQSN